MHHVIFCKARDPFASLLAAATALRIHQESDLQAVSRHRSVLPRSGGQLAMQRYHNRPKIHQTQGLTNAEPVAIRSRQREDRIH
jgi:hypothetical protein